MFGRRKIEVLALMLGDLALMVFALWLTLALRYPKGHGTALLAAHLAIFGPLFPIWIVGFFIFNLYGKPSLAWERDVPLNLFQAQTWNSVVAALVLYFLPQVGIAPRTNLFIDLLLSFALLLTWRVFLYPVIVPRHREQVLFIGSTPESRQIEQELTEHPRYQCSAYRVEETESAQQLLSTIHDYNIGTIVVDFKNNSAKELLGRTGVAPLIGLRFLDLGPLYEELFDRVPLSELSDQWFFENIARGSTSWYDASKRAVDIVLSLLIALFSLILYPFVWLAITLDDGGPVFIEQERVGKNNHAIRIFKFRSMTGNDQGNYQAGGTTLRATRIGALLRRTRIDELPQIWNVLKGDLSFVGPRPELIPLAHGYEHEIPFYNVRHLVAPGLSGWAQIHQENHPHHKAAFDQTREKLSYDFYYLKHRSLWLDLQIMLKTIRTLLSRSGL